MATSSDVAVYPTAIDPEATAVLRPVKTVKVPKSLSFNAVCDASGVSDPVESWPE
jgi:hypothetical protein